MNEKRGRWVPLHTLFREYENDAAQWMSERDHRLAQKTRDEPKDDRRRRHEPDEEPTE